MVIKYSGSRLIGRLGSRHSVPFIRFSRLTDVIIPLDMKLPIYFLPMIFL